MQQLNQGVDMTKTSSSD